MFSQEMFAFKFQMIITEFSIENNKIELLNPLIYLK